MESLKKYTKLLLNILIPLLMLYIVCIWGPRLIRFFLPFVIGWLIAMIANPLVRFLEKRLKIVRKHSSVFLVVFVLGCILAVLYLIIVKLSAQMSGFIEDVPLYYQKVSVEVQTVLVRLEGMMQFLPEEIKNSFIQITDNLGETMNLAVQKLASPTMTAAGNAVKSIPAALVYFIITVFSAYLFIVERDTIVNWMRQYTPSSGSRYYAYVKKDVKQLILGYFLAQLKIMGIMAVILAVGFLILDIKYGLLLAVLIAVLDFLPVFGTGTVLVPWAVVQLFSGQYPLAFGLFMIYLLTMILRQVIQPKIVGDTMGLSPLLTLLFLYLGFKISGIAGMILAVPIGMIFLNLYHFGAFDSFVSSLKILIHDLNKFRRS